MSVYLQPMDMDLVRRSVRNARRRYWSTSDEYFTPVTDQEWEALVQEMAADGMTVDGLGRVTCEAQEGMMGREEELRDLMEALRSMKEEFPLNPSIPQERAAMGGGAERDVKAELREWEWGEPLAEAYREICVEAGEVVVNAIREELEEEPWPQIDFGNGEVHVTILLLDGLIEHTLTIPVEELAEGMVSDMDTESVEEAIATLRQFADALERGLTLPVPPVSPTEK